MASTSQAQSTFEQIKDARASNKDIILVIGHGYYRSTIANFMCNTPEIADAYSIVDMGSFYVLQSSIKGGSLSDVRRWISSRHLRRLCERKVKIVWALDSDTSGGNSSCSLSNQLDITWSMFKEERKRVVVVVTQEQSTKHGQVQRDFDNVVSECIQTDQVRHILTAVNRADAFTMPVNIGSADTDRITAWSNEKVILFGRTGSGKSTVARMLTQGNLDSPSNFVSGSSARGVTREVVREQGRGWFVTDTPGFGETKIDGTIPTEEAIRKLKDFMSKVGGLHAHFVCVIRYNRIDQYDEILWNFFVKLLPNAEDNLSVVVTCCENGLTEKDKSDIHSRFKECKRFTWVNFKTLSGVYKTEGLVTVARKNAKDSLDRLEREFGDAGLSEIQFHKVDLSSETLNYMKSRSTTKLTSMIKTESMEAIATFAHYLIRVPVIHAKALLRKRNNIDESFMLLPQ